MIDPHVLIRAIVGAALVATPLAVIIYGGKNVSKDDEHDDQADHHW